MLGKCSNCKTQIMDLELRGQKRLLTNYRDHIVELSNGTLMRVGVCVNCKALLVAGLKVKETADNILKNHKAYWDGDRYAPKGYKSLIIIDPNSTENKYMQKRADGILDEKERLDLQKQESVEVIIKE